MRYFYPRSNVRSAGNGQDDPSDRCDRRYRIRGGKDAWGALEGGSIESYDADLSTLSGARALGEAVAGKHAKLNVLINNAGVCKTSGPILIRPTSPNVKSLWRWLKRFWRMWASRVPFARIGTGVLACSERTQGKSRVDVSPPMVS